MTSSNAEHLHVTVVYCDAVWGPLLVHAFRVDNS